MLINIQGQTIDTEAIWKVDDIKGYSFDIHFFNKKSINISVYLEFWGIISKGRLKDNDLKDLETHYISQIKNAHDKVIKHWNGSKSSIPQIIIESFKIKE